MFTRIPKHLIKYIVEQNYAQYTYIDQACWKFIMKISIAFFKKNADDTYLDGLKNTGITINKIPKIKSINKKLIKFGWKAVCVRGFIPPQAFMEFQSLKILPIAADMRNHEHITYTPSPDIVHEAAGHAPIIANKDYSNYLIKYGEIAAKAIISSEDMNLYYAIRDLSDIKENIHATSLEISKCEKQLKKIYNNISYVSESAMLSRMNWWTVEYGLIGNIKSPKIYGAGLLSSVGESANCLNNSVKKIPFSLDCINYKYDITEQQPQLFVTPSFKHLTKELKILSKMMSYKKGGLYGVKEAIKAKTLCTIEFDNLIQVAGIVTNYINNNENINYIKLIGPCQIAINNKEINSHGISYHKDGYSTPVGKLKKYNKPISKLTPIEREKLNLKKDKFINLDFKNDINVSGIVKNILKKESRIILITLTRCKVTHNDNILFDPSWGIFDLICGNKITSVYGGPCDSINYYNNLKTKKSRYKKYNNKNTLISDNKILNNYFKKIDNIKKNNFDLKKLHILYNKMKNDSIDDWLLKYEFLELTNCNRNLDWINNLYLDLSKLSKEKTDLSQAIKRGLNLLN